MSAPTVRLTDEQQDILREATAYRYPYFSMGPNLRDGGNFSLTIWASAPNPSRTIWGPQPLATGTWPELQALRKAAMAEYNRLTKGSQ